jgi:prevent-host-death family protein
MKARSNAGLFSFASRMNLAILAELAKERIMATMTATDAKNKFGQMLEMARTEPVRIQKNGRDVGVVLSPEDYQSLAAGNGDKVNPAVRKLHAESIARWGKVYDALSK